MSKYWGLLSGVSQQARQVGSLSRNTRTDKGKLLDMIPVDNEIPQGLLGTVPGKEKHPCKSIECLREVEVGRGGGTAPSPWAKGVHNSPVLYANTMGLMHWTDPESLTAE